MGWIQFAAICGIVLLLIIEHVALCVCRKRIDKLEQQIQNRRW